MTRCATRASRETEIERSFLRGAAAHVRRALQALRGRYLQGIWIIRSALLNCLLTCVGGAFADLLYDGWGRHAWASLVRHIGIGYAGAVVIVLLVLPWLSRRTHVNQGTRDQRSVDSFHQRKEYPEKAKGISRSASVAERRGRDAGYVNPGFEASAADRDQ